MEPKRHASNEVGVRELRQNLSVYLRRIKRGEELVVTERGLAVARLAPLAKPAEVIGRLVGEGVLHPAQRTGGLAELADPVDTPGAGPSASQLLIDDRRNDER